MIVSISAISVLFWVIPIIGIVVGATSMGIMALALVVLFVSGSRSSLLSRQVCFSVVFAILTGLIYSALGFRILPVLLWLWISFRWIIRLTRKRRPLIYYLLLFLVRIFMSIALFILIPVVSWLIVRIVLFWNTIFLIPFLAIFRRNWR